MSTLVAILLGILYFAALVWLGLATLRKGHFAFFLVGLFFPPLWIVGALLPPTAESRDGDKQSGLGAL
jgi:fatty acid desaturase